MSFDDLEGQLLGNKKNLSDNSLKTYKNQLKTLFKSIWKNEEFNYKNFFDNVDDVIKYLKSIDNINTRKTKAAALVILTMDKDKVVNKYRDLMKEDLEKYNNDIKKNKMTDKQKENWLKMEDINKIFNKMRKETKKYWNEKKLNKDEFNELQRFIILSCYVLIPPRRLKDYLNFKIKNFDLKKDNYLDKKNKEFVFNSYKTAKFHGQERVKIPSILQKILIKWMDKNNNDFLLVDFYNNQLKPSALTKILNSIFNKKISVNMLRHIYITEKISPKIKELEEVAKDMGHTTNEQKNYVKF